MFGPIISAMKYIFSTKASRAAGERAHADKDIDFSDIPETDFSKGIRGKYFLRMTTAQRKKFLVNNLEIESYDKYEKQIKSKKRNLKISTGGYRPSKSKAPINPPKGGSSVKKGPK